MLWQRKNLLGIRDLSREEIQFILDTAQPMKDFLKRRIKKLPTLRGQSMVTIFYEASTRTRLSFELAAKYLGADTVNFNVSTSSVKKGESFRDTVRTIESMGCDLVVVRHSAAGTADFLARVLNLSVINAGDGLHEHPTQALLDIFTILQHKEKVDGLTVTIVGDIKHSRVAHSDIWGLTKMGAKVRLCGPKTLIPLDIEREGVEVFDEIEQALAGADVVMALRLQRERQEGGLLPSLPEYQKLFGIDCKRFSLAKPDALLMHPGPVNRGVELTDEVMEIANTVIEEQVTNGVAVRMALLYLLMGGDQSEKLAG